MKPSDIDAYYVRDQEDNLCPVPCVISLRKVIKELHDRIEVLEKANSINLDGIKMNGVMPKQEPNDFLSEDERCHCKPKSIYADCPIHGEKKEKLADYLDAVYLKTMTIAEARSAIRKAVEKELKHFLNEDLANSVTEYLRNELL